MCIYLERGVACITRSIGSADEYVVQRTGDGVSSRAQFVWWYVSSSISEHGAAAISPSASASAKRRDYYAFFLFFSTTAAVAHSTSTLWTDELEPKDFEQRKPLILLCKYLFIPRGS